MGRTLVIKIGTSTLVDCAGKLDRSFIIDLTSQLAECRQDGWDVVLVTSGAIRAGIELLNSRAIPQSGKEPVVPQSNDLVPGSLPYKQAAAAIGQGRLMHTYTEAFGWRNIDCAQVLLTRDDIAESRRAENARNTLCALLAMGVVPIINENDTVAVDEIKFGDNDKLAALVAVLVSADRLIILSDVEGVYPVRPHPEQEPNPIPIPTIECIDDSVVGLAGDSAGELGTGGMRTKVEAARIATHAGIETVIARGRRPNVIRQVLLGEPVGTTFTARKKTAG